MGDEVCLRIGRPDDDHVIIGPTRREFPDSPDFWDGNWFYATVRISAGAFDGEYEALLRTTDFVSFRDALKQLHQVLRGHASFETIEDWITIRIEGDGRGHFDAECEAKDAPGIANRLMFTLAFDQTDIPDMLKSLNAICESFPVVGHQPISVQRRPPEQDG
jgi:hypothetical protein